MLSSSRECNSRDNPGGRVFPALDRYGLFQGRTVNRIGHSVSFLFSGLWEVLSSCMVVNVIWLFMTILANST